jgi:hypothetical protein
MVSVPRLRTRANHDILPALCSTKNKPIKRAAWAPILNHLELGEKQLINWCPEVPFPNRGNFPGSRHIFRGMVNMFFNPESARRLRLVPLKGV